MLDLFAIEIAVILVKGKCSLDGIKAFVLPGEKHGILLENGRFPKDRGPVEVVFLVPPGRGAQKGVVWLLLKLFLWEWAFREKGLFLLGLKEPVGYDPKGGLD